MTRLALFDCDGTLVDSGGVICTAMARACEGEGLPAPDDAATRRIIGLSLLEAVTALHPRLPAPRLERLAGGYKRAFQDLRAENAVHEPLFEGIADVLATLAARGWALGVATGKSDRGLSLCLAAHGIAPHFVTLQTADRHPSKPHPAMVQAGMREADATPATTVVIGDTTFDMGMARAAGARAIGVAWGYHPVDELRGAGADAIATRPDELPDLLEAP